MATGLAGIPLLLRAALRSIHRTGLCYGYRVDAPADRPYLLGVLELSTVDDPGRRLIIHERLSQMAGGRERPEEPPIGLGGVERGVAGDLALEVVPLIGDPVTIVLDYTMMKRVDRTARMVFQERWLRDAGRIEGEIVPAPSHPRDDALRNLHDLAGQAAYLDGVRAGLRRRLAGRRGRPGVAIASRVGKTSYRFQAERTGNWCQARIHLTFRALATSRVRIRASSAIATRTPDSSCAAFSRSSRLNMHAWSLFGVTRMHVSAAAWS